jgi:hypothetical protein
MSMDRTGDPGQIRRSFVKDMGTSSYFTALDWGLMMYCVFFCTSAYTIYPYTFYGE